MKLLNYKSLFYFGLLLNILICSYLWNYVSLPFDSSKSAVGILTLKNINPFNDSVRYILFILIPLSYYFLGEYFNDISIAITDLTGKTILINTFKNSKILNLNIDEPAGVYILKIESGNKKAIVRLIKE